MGNALKDRHLHWNSWLTPQNKYSIKDLLDSNTKDDIPPEWKSGIEQFNFKECKNIYPKKDKESENSYQKLKRSP